MKGKKLLYLVLILLTVLLVFLLTYNYLFNNYDTTGKINIIKDYNELIISDARINFDSTTKIKINNEKKTLNIEIPNLNDYKENKTLTVELINIGNKQMILKEAKIEDITSNAMIENILLETNINNYTIIEPGETKLISIDIKYINKTNMENPNYNFDIKFVIER